MYLQFHKNLSVLSYFTIAGIFDSYKGQYMIELGNIN